MMRSLVEALHMKDISMNNIGIPIHLVIYGEDIKLEQRLMIVEFMNIIGIRQLHHINSDTVKPH
jgi:hypothetical protein